MSQAAHSPRDLVLHWQVTQRSHQTPTDCSEELAFSDLLSILEQFDVLVEHWRRAEQRPDAKGRIVLHGGEPLLRPDLFELLEEIGARRDRIEHALITDGMSIDDAVARRLAAARASFVQIGLDGTRATHDRLRQAGSFDQRVAALRLLHQHNVPTVIAFGAAQSNYRELGSVVRIARALGAARVWADLGARVFQGGEPRAAAMLTAEQNRQVCEAIAKEQASPRNDGAIDVVAHRCLHFLDQHFELDACGAGDTRIAIGPTGDLQPCDRLRARVGNVLQQPLAELYGRSSIMLALRDPNTVADGCEGCTDEPTCRGGLKCLSYAAMGNPFAADPSCWLARRLPIAAEGSG